MTYTVKEMYYTLQGEGFHTGRPALFIRFAGCNLWSGRETDRAAAQCPFCDTDFVGVDGPGGGRFPDAIALAAAAAATWAAEAPGHASRFTVLTGGEPVLQLDASLLAALRRRGFTLAVETNGTLPVPPGIDWICVSPKVNAALVQRSGDELKLVYPQRGGEPERYESLAFDHFFLQPMDGPAVERHTHLAIDYCRRHPRWHVSLQSHKYLGMP